jgi:enamine deaminase RidA (YjgF/YER057c/UK114 family)
LNLTGARVLRTTCFLSSLDGYANAREAVSAAFPSAAIDFVQMQRLPVRTPVECEATAALDQPSVGRAVRAVFLNPQGLPPSPNYSQIVMVSPGPVVITGTQLGFGPQETDIRLAFGRLGKALETQHASFKDVVYSHIYPVSDDVAGRIRTLRFEFFEKLRPPASTLVPFESLPSLDASFGVEVIAAPR